VRLLTEWRIYGFFTRCAVNLWPVGPDDSGNSHFSEPLRRRCGWGAVSGVCLVPPDLPLFDCGYSLGAGSESDRWSIIVMNFVGSACLQLGYLAGTVPSFLIIAARQSRRERPQPVRPLLYRRSV